MALLKELKSKCSKFITKYTSTLDSEIFYESNHDSKLFEKLLIEFIYLLLGDEVELLEVNVHPPLMGFDAYSVVIEINSMPMFSDNYFLYSISDGVFRSDQASKIVKDLFKHILMEYFHIE